jgi:serine protease
MRTRAAWRHPTIALLVLGLLSVGALVPVDAAAPPAADPEVLFAPAAPTDPPAPPATPDRGTERILVELSEAATHEEVLDLTEDETGLRASGLRRLDGRAAVIDLPRALPPAAMASLTARLRTAGLAEHIAPDLPMVPTTVPNDPVLRSQWNLTGSLEGRSTEGIGAAAAWSRTIGSPEVTVAVLDTGHLPHPDLHGRTVPGYDLVDRDSDPTDPPCPTAGSHGHGLAVASVLGATTDNGMGVAGVDQRARLQPVRVLPSCGSGSMADVIDGIRWAAGLRVQGTPENPTPADVLNLSLGTATSASCDRFMQAAIDDAVAAGAVVVVAAGNSAVSLDEQPRVPASCDNVITVAATSPVGDLAYYSNHGSAVTIAAPGGDHTLPEFGMQGLVLAAAPPTDHLAFEAAYGWTAGTSVATPQVSGTVSLLLAANPQLSVAEVREILQETARAFPSSGVRPEADCSTGAELACGAGQLDAGEAVAAALQTATGTREPPPPPAAPGAPSATSDGASVSLAWAAPSSASGPVAYQVHRTGGGGTCTPSSVLRAHTTSRSFRDTGVVSGRTYTWCVVATDGLGASSRASAAVALTVPPRAPKLSASGGDRRVALSWTDVATNDTGAVTYRLHRSTGSSCATSSPLVTSQVSTSFTDTGLDPERTYRYCLTAQDQAGNRSPLSNGASATTNPISFSDVSTSHPHWQGIRWMAQEGITLGCDADGTRFCPNDPVTRAQMASFLTRALALSPGATDIFSDVNPRNTHASSIGAMHREAITLGCASSPARYCPTDIVTRAQMGSFLARALALSPGATDIFSDVNPRNTHASSIGAMHREAITLGCASSPARYCPTDVVTRGQMASFLYRAIAE